MNTIDFHMSTTKELLAIKDRVRNLVDHWGEDGRHQEAVLKTMIQRFLPEKFRVGSGFVVRQSDDRGSHESSTQIDLLIYDTCYPVLFKENDFVILTPDSVVGIIEVKANAMNQNLQAVVKKASETGRFIFEGRLDKTKAIFNGIFSFESDVQKYHTIASHILRNWNAIKNTRFHEKFSVNHIALDKNIFYKYWELEYAEQREPHYLYQVDDLSFSFFISNLMDWIGGVSVIQNYKLWYPVDKTVRVMKKF